MLAMLVLAAATPAEARRKLFRRGHFRCCKARVCCTQQSGGKADAGVTDGQPSGTPGTISPKPATEGDAAKPAAKDDVIDVDPDAKPAAKRAAEEEPEAPVSPTAPAPPAPAPPAAPKA